MTILPKGTKIRIKARSQLNVSIYNGYYDKRVNDYCPPDMHSEVLTIKEFITTLDSMKIKNYYLTEEGYRVHPNWIADDHIIKDL